MNNYEIIIIIIINIINIINIIIIIIYEYLKKDVLSVQKVLLSTGSYTSYNHKIFLV